MQRYWETRRKKNRTNKQTSIFRTREEQMEELQYGLNYSTGTGKLRTWYLLYNKLSLSNNKEIFTDITETFGNI